MPVVYSIGTSPSLVPSSTGGIEKTVDLILNERTFTFPTDYPTDIDQQISLMEFEAILRLINEEMMVESREILRGQWRAFFIIIMLCFVVIGLFLVPYLFYLEQRQRKILKALWDRLDKYFMEINRKTYYDRDLEWRLIPDEQKYKDRDIVHPLLAIKIVILKRIPRSQRRATTGYGEDFMVCDARTMNDSTQMSTSEIFGSKDGTARKNAQVFPII